MTMINVHFMIFSHVTHIFYDYAFGEFGQETFKVEKFHLNYKNEKLSLKELLKITFIQKSVFNQQQFNTSFIHVENCFLDIFQ